MKYIIFLLISIVCLSASCNKEHLPEYYFQCKVDGKLYVPDNCANCERMIILGDTVLLLNANRGHEVLGFGVFDKPVTKGTCPLNHERTKHSGDFDNTIGNPSDIFRTDSLRTGKLTISILDKTNKTIAGTFYFEAYNAVQNKTIKITDGKFRLKYTTN